MCSRNIAVGNIEKFDVLTIIIQVMHACLHFLGLQTVNNRLLIMAENWTLPYTPELRTFMQAVKTYFPRNSELLIIILTTLMNYSYVFITNSMSSQYI